MGFQQAEDLTIWELVDYSKAKVLFRPEDDASDEICMIIAIAVEKRKCEAETLEKMKEWLREQPKIDAKDWKHALINCLKVIEERCRDHSNTKYIPPEQFVEGNVPGWEKTADKFHEAVRAVEQERAMKKTVDRSPELHNLLEHAES